MLDVERGGGGEGVKGANSSHRLVLVWDLISAMFYCHTHSPTCSIIVSKDVFKAKMSFCPKNKKTSRQCKQKTDLWGPDP